MELLQGRINARFRRLLRPTATPVLRKPAHSVLLRHGVSLLVTLIALLVMLSLNQWVPMQNSPFILFFASVMVSAWYGGLGVGIFATVISAITVSYFFLPPVYSLRLLNVEEYVQVSLFVGVSLMICILSATRQALVETLQETTKTLQALIQAAPLAISVLDQRGKINLWNPAAEKIFGWQEEEVLGQVNPIVPQSKLAEFQANLDSALSGQPLRGAELCRQRKDGSPIDIELWTAAFPNVDGKGTSSIVAIAVDLTERKRLELTLQRRTEELTQAHRMKDDFFAMLSHELRTPLNSILGWSNLLRTRQVDAETITCALETIERNARLQSQLIDDILDLSRIMQGKLRLQLFPVQLMPVIRAAVNSMRPSAEAKAIQLECIVDPAVGKVLGDPTRLQQIVWNLLSNAIKFTPEAGQVKIYLAQIQDDNSPETAFAEIRVIDTGKGIQEDFLPYVFDRFQQADSSTTRSDGGLGLGLAIVRYLVNMHKGTVQAASLGIGQGATFTVRLPLLGGEDTV